MTSPKTVFITGASSGLGKAAAKLFHEHGWKVVATMRKPEREEELTAQNGYVLLKLDVSDPQDIARAAKEALDAVGHIDVVLNNAGYGLAGPLEGTEDENLVRQIDTNLLGPMRIVRAFLPHMRQRATGTIINVTSIGGLVTLPFTSVYHGTKWGLEGWSESMWYELKAQGIGIKTVSPGGIATDFAGRSLDYVQHPDYERHIQEVWRVVGARQQQYSTPRQIAAVLSEAAPDGPAQLRYVAGQDAKQFYAQRQEQGDQGYIEANYDLYFGQLPQE